MIAMLMIAVAAGAASALMFASIISGALVSLLLFYLAPLPLMVTALGWGPLAAAVGGIAASATLGVIFGTPYSIAFAVMVALPGWWLGHLALLGRPVDPMPAGNTAAQAPPAIEWYPVGRILVWIAVFAFITTTGALLTLGADAETITAALRRGLIKVLSASSQPIGDVERFADMLVIVAPIAATIIAMVTLTLNLWLAAKVTLTSGRLNRPWPELRATVLPPMTLVALLGAIALSFVGGIVAILAQIVTTALMIAYALIGFAVLHTLTLSMASRGFLLAGAYTVVAAFGWPIIAMVALGIADALFGLRQRFLQTRPPPLPAS